MENILSALLEIPFWCSFRVPTAVNVHSTYPVPPVTTVYGLLACAMGWPSDYLGPLEKMKINVGLQQRGERIEGYHRIIKWDRAHKNFYTHVVKQKLYQPLYSLFVKGDAILIKELAAALHNPHFPLCLGESDDLVEVKDIQVYPAAHDKVTEIDSLLPVEQGKPLNKVDLVYLPVQFKGNVTDRRTSWEGVQYQGYYLAEKIQVAEPVMAFCVGKQRVVF